MMKRLLVRLYTIIHKNESCCGTTRGVRVVKTRTKSMKKRRRNKQ